MGLMWDESELALPVDVAGEFRADSLHGHRPKFVVQMGIRVQDQATRSRCSS